MRKFTESSAFLDQLDIYRSGPAANPQPAPLTDAQRYSGTNAEFYGVDPASEAARYEERRKNGTSDSIDWVMLGRITAYSFHNMMSLGQVSRQDELVIQRTTGTINENQFWRGTFISAGTRLAVVATGGIAGRAAMSLTGSTTATGALVGWGGDFAVQSADQEVYNQTDGYAGQKEYSFKQAAYSTAFGTGFGYVGGTSWGNSNIVIEAGPGLGRTGAQLRQTGAVSLPKVRLVPNSEIGLVNGRLPAERLADKLQRLPSKERPNMVAVIRHADGTYSVGVNQGGYMTPKLQSILDEVGVNQFGAQCAEVNAVARAMAKGRSLEGASVTISKVRGQLPPVGKHGLFEPPCSTCSPMLKKLELMVVPGRSS